MEEISAMLLAFSVRNFKSIRDLQTLTLEARADDHLDAGNVFESGRRRILKSAVIYGPNASGKSNLIQAMQWMRYYIFNSSKETQAREPILVEPFRFSALTENAPSHFEAEFLLDGFVFRYGFTVSSLRVESEWLFRKSPTSRPAKLFTREGQDFSLSSHNFPEGKALTGRTRGNALFLSVCAQWNGPEALKVLSWFDQFRHITGIRDDGYPAFTSKCLQSARFQPGLLEMARQANPTISAIHSEWEEATGPPDPQRRSTPDTVPGNIPARPANIRTMHTRFDGRGQPSGQVEFDLREESDGTRKFIALSGPISHTLQTGSILVLDELESSLHPKLTQAIVDLFHSPLNDKNAQLICATHDVTLLDPDRFRRDQIWFCEKDGQGATDLYSLADFDSGQVRSDSRFSRQYLLGLFGAVPRLARFEEAVEHAIRE